MPKMGGSGNPAQCNQLTREQYQRNSNLSTNLENNIRELPVPINQQTEIMQLT